MINIYICIPHIILENVVELIDNDSVTKTSVSLSKNVRSDSEFFETQLELST